MSNEKHSIVVKTEKLNYKPTRKLAYARTVKMQDVDTSRLVINHDLTIEGKKDTYTVFGRNRIGIGGESQVFRCVSKEGKKEYVAKIYDNMSTGPSQDGLRQNIYEFLARNNDYSKNHLMPLYDCGKVTIDNNGEKYERYVDIIPICESEIFNEGNKISFERLKSEIIPQLAAALNTLHENGFVHRDVKPSNIFTLENTIVLGDFGTVSMLERDVDLALTQTNRGTLGYAAPEIMSGYVTPKLDWYSFGCTIAVLYLGRHPYEEQLKKRESQVYWHLMNTYGLNLNCPAEEKSLQILVNSLTRTAENERVGYKEVVEWCENPDAFVPPKYKENADWHSMFSFNFEGVVCNSPEMLADEMLSNWDKGIDYLYRGGLQNSVVISGLAQFNQALAAKAGEIIENRETATNHNLGLARFLHYLSGNKYIYWKGKRYETLIDVARRIGTSDDVDKDLIELLQDKYFSWIIKEKSYDSSKEKAINYLNFIENFTKKHGIAGLYLFKYEVLNEDKYLNSSSYDELFEHLFKPSSDFEKESIAMIQDKKLLGFMAAKGQNVQEIEEYLDSYEENDTVYNLTCLYLLFEKNCLDKEKVRQHYCLYGPKAYLFWIQNNLDVYEFEDNELSEEIKAIILSGKMKKEMTISQLEHEANIIYEGVNDLKTYFYGNPLMVCFSLEHSQTDKFIRAKDLTAYFVFSYFDAEIPYGYKMYLDGGISVGRID